MSLRLRMGRVSVSSRGRVGVSAGPVSWSGGGRRSSDPGFLGWLTAIAVVVAIVIFVVMWPLSLWGHALHLRPSWHQLMHRDKDWMHAHYPLVGLRYFGAAVLLAIAVTTAVRPLLKLQNERAGCGGGASDAARNTPGGSKGPLPPLSFPRHAHIEQLGHLSGGHELRAGRAARTVEVVKRELAAHGQRSRPRTDQIPCLVALSGKSSTRSSVRRGALGRARRRDAAEAGSAVPRW
jgi:hypothetical protein